MTKFRPDISKKSKYWISKHRYYELKHFCLQYPEWVEQVNDILWIKSGDQVLPVSKTKRYRNNGMEYITDILEKYEWKIRLVDQCCLEADEELSDWLLMAVTEGKTYENLRTMYDIPCSRNTFYDRYRKFFFIISQKLQRV